MDDLITEFLDEIWQNLAEISIDLGRLKKNPGDAAALAAIFRLVHTIKGTSRFAKFDRLEALAHAAEDKLGLCRDNPDPPLADIAMLVNEMKDCVDSITAQDGKGAASFSGAGLWAGMPGRVRDLGTELGKKIELRIPNGFDPAIFDLVKSPLIHIIHNCADHGIEEPSARIASGKPETGTITLDGADAGSEIVITVSDDGRGLSADRIKRKAIEKGLLSGQDAAAMTPDRARQMVFSPGFSTVDEVTAMSGRGVGLDAVRAHVENLGGSVTVESDEGSGSAFIIRIPRKT